MNTSFFLVNDSYKVTEKYLFPDQIFFHPNDVLLW